ncbi:IS200/IS605 family transposase [Candidatus Lariskella endosymbiont of Hedychridium roseum]|uniref:IS200/IS605 family transposase n=1 Tax=Candidatus Lariskella endosymbiont of Hedychridium roseum TaxID=3077949 RepID=UPI0030CE519C
MVFCTKYRYRVLTGQVAIRTREVIREICAANYINIISGSMSPDHVHILALVPPSISISKAVQYIKGISSRKLLQEFALLRKRYWGTTSLGQRVFCCDSWQCEFRRSAKIYRTA